jgi:5-methylcytosine-specific restriction endonuclease McrA
MCHICNLVINPRHKWPHPGSLTIDHIVPITPFEDGQNPGTHTWDNVRAAHASCNSRRGNRPLDQAC